ncbi:MAG: hypothetical protein OEM05_11505 [Myxococcales bacterium]|nr:hypothetical protein [Myxococcales bacterium]
MPEKGEAAKIERLLNHWMEHNGEHASEFMAWAEKSRKLGRAGVSEGIVRAAGELEKANEFLRAALKALKER